VANQSTGVGHYVLYKQYFIWQRTRQKRLQSSPRRKHHHNSSTIVKRNPRVFCGQYITITRRRDGTLHPNFRPMKMGPDFSAERYATAVGNELMWALEGLIEK
jgi:hypothetical protein